MNVLSDSKDFIALTLPPSVKKFSNRVIGQRILAFRRTGHGAFLTFAGCLLAVAICGMLIPTMMQDITTRETPQNSSVWVWRGSKDYVLIPVMKVMPKFPNEILAKSFNPNRSHFVIADSQDFSKTVYKLIKPASKDTAYKQIFFYDPTPKKDLKDLFTTSFAKCEYRKCKFAKKIEDADAVVFMASRLNMTKAPTFKRRPGQMWVFHTQEPPSRFNYFASFNKTNLKEQFNWTMTFRNDSDIKQRYGYLKLKPHPDAKDYDAMYDKKSRVAAWFINVCPSRDRHTDYVKRMKTRMDIDVYGKCGTLQCATSSKGAEATKLADNSTCYPLVSGKYKFYLAFETSMCRDYVTNEFFKIFGEVPVDTIPVVRGGANYKKYFPADMYVDASDFSTPEDLADYLMDLAYDKERYVRMLKAKDRYVAVPAFPEWQCGLCKKLFLEKNKKQYKDVVDWYTKGQCHDDPVESNLF